MSPKLRRTMPSARRRTGYNGKRDANSKRPADVKNGSKSRILLVNGKSCDLRNAREHVEEYSCRFGHHSNTIGCGH